MRFMFSLRAPSLKVSVWSLFRLSLARVFFGGYVLVFSWPAYADWQGSWETGDEWGSSYRIDIFEDGTARADYGDGWVGTWQIEEGGNLSIEWDSGWQDYIFNGVMGRQRLASKKGRRGYSSYINSLD